jgi:hypothetical protein
MCQKNSVPALLLLMISACRQKMHRIVQPLWWKRLRRSSFAKVEAVTGALLRHRPLCDLHEIPGAEPLGESGLDIASGELDVNASGTDRFVERQSKY